MPKFMLFGRARPRGAIGAYQRETIEAEGETPEAAILSAMAEWDFYMTPAAVEVVTTRYEEVP